MRVIVSIDRIIGRIEKSLVVVILFVMITLSCIQIVLRNFFASGIPVNDIILRHLTLMLVFLGASMATQKEKHLKIDIVPRLLSENQQRYVSIITGVISMIVCVILARASWTFIVFERQSDTTFVSNIPLWYAKLIIPCGFLLIAFRLVLLIAARILPNKHTKNAEFGENKGKAQ